MYMHSEIHCSQNISRKPDKDMNIAGPCYGLRNRRYIAGAQSDCYYFDGGWSLSAKLGGGWGDSFQIPSKMLNSRLNSGGGELCLRLDGGLGLGMVYNILKLS